MSQFAEIKLTEWDNQKLGIGKPPKGGDATLLYNKKLPILTIIGDNITENYILQSYKGLVKSKVFDEGTGKYTDEWNGEWEVSFKICDAVKDATPLQKKLMNILDDLTSKVEKAFKTEVKFKPVSYSYITKMNEFGIEEIVGVDENKPAYLKVKVGYTYTPGCKMMKDSKSKDVPVFEARRPKPEFYDISRASKQMLLKYPDPSLRPEPTEEELRNGTPKTDVGASTSMNAAPKIMLSVYKSALGVFITKRLMQCYFTPVPLGGGGEDDQMISMLRDIENLDISVNQ